MSPRILDNVSWPHTNRPLCQSGDLSIAYSPSDEMVKLWRWGEQ